MQLFLCICAVLLLFACIHRVYFFSFFNTIAFTYQKKEKKKERKKEIVGCLKMRVIRYKGVNFVSFVTFGSGL